MKYDVLVRHPNDLTVEWAQRVVDSRYSGIRISALHVVSIDIGTTTRVRLWVEHDGPNELPRRWFVKLPSLAWRARIITALPRLLHTEVRFYREAAQVVPTAVPDFLAAQSERGRGAILVLRDVTECGAVPGSPGDTLTPAQAALVVEELARFHAHFWGKAELLQTFGWLAGPVRRLEDGLSTTLAVPLMKLGLRRAGQIVPSALHALAVHYARRRSTIMRFLSSAPQTLVHHDCHPGNLFWHKYRPGFLDWQLVRFGEGIGDVAYFLATSLNPETRRIHEASLVSAYALALQSHGVPDVEPDSLMQRYRAHLIYPFEAMVITLAVGGMMKPENNYELIRRATAAIEDRDAFGAVMG
jgi:hypothetical protein